MDLWIRSQDKTSLAKVIDIECYEENSCSTKMRGYFSKFEDDWVILGQYATKERAIEIMNEIQLLILNNFEIKNKSYYESDLFLKGNILTSMARLYEMPKE